VLFFFSASGARIKGIVIYYIGEDAEIEDAAHNLASQMFSEDTHIQIFYTVKHNNIMTENGQSSGYLVRTYDVLSMTALSKKYKKEYNISMDNFESDVEKLIRFNGTNETFSVFLQNRELRKNEEDLFHKIDETLANQYRFRIEKDGSFYKNLQVSMSKDGKTKYLKLNNWKLLRSGGTLLFPEIFSGVYFLITSHRSVLLLSACLFFKSDKSVIIHSYRKKQKKMQRLNKK
jgi:hypothetical protein